jgi:hypothetical protein
VVDRGAVLEDVERADVAQVEVGHQSVVDLDQEAAVVVVERLDPESPPWLTLAAPVSGDQPLDNSC